MKGSRFKVESELSALRLAPCAFLIRPMTISDLEAVTAVESENTSPWTTEQLAGELEQTNGWLFAAEVVDSGLVCGFACGRRYAGEAELLKIAVSQEYQRQGVATQLMSHLLCYLAGHEVGRCFLELRATNLPALALYERFCFRQVGLRKNYYTSPSEDAIIMKRPFVKRGTSP